MTSPGRLVLLMLACAGLGLMAAPPTRMVVQVRQGQLRATPSFLGKLAQNVAYGASVEVFETRGDWMQVKTAQGASGWIHKSALTTKKLALASGATTAKTGVSKDELALAGKGFNSDIEKEYKRQKQGLNFEAVDRLEQVKATPAQVEAFLKAGGLKTEGGAK